jgi:oligopeptide/dipeptide ABC transporter ATP-binding protein
VNSSALSLEVEGLNVVFPGRRGQPTVHAVRDLSLTLVPGESLGLVGESGSGKSTTARGIMHLVKPRSGVVRLNGAELTAMGSRELRRARRDLQMVFQDPYSSLDPSQVVGVSIAEPLEVHERLSSSERHARVAELLRKVNLSPDFAERYPYEFSGGQRQRLAIARAIALNPSVVICDEAVSALDVSTQNEIINLLEDLQDDLGMSYLFIAHDLAVVRHIADRIAVMYLGHVIEEGPSERVFADAAHPYTEMLLAAVPSPDPRQRLVDRARGVVGELPDPANPPSGCPFRTRCRYAMSVCEHTMPPATPVDGGGTVRCHLQTDGPHLAGRTLQAIAEPVAANFSGGPSDPPHAAN